MIFVVAEHKDNKLKPITSELLVFAQRVGRDFSQPVTAVVLGAGVEALETSGDERCAGEESRDASLLQAMDRIGRSPAM